MRLRIAAMSAVLDLEAGRSGAPAFAPPIDSDPPAWRPEPIIREAATSPPGSDLATGPCVAGPMAFGGDGGLATFPRYNHLDTSCRAEILFAFPSAPSRVVMGGGHG